MKCLRHKNWRIINVITNVLYVVWQMCLSSGLYTTQPQFLYKLKKINFAVLKELDVSIQLKSYVHFCLCLTVGMINYMAVEIYKSFPA